MNKNSIEIPLVKAIYEELQQVICELQVERYKYKTTIDKIKEILKDNTNYLFKAEKIYVKCEDELLKSTVLQLINNDLVKNDKIFELLEEID